MLLRERTHNTCMVNSASRLIVGCQSMMHPLGCVQDSRLGTIQCKITITCAIGCTVPRCWKEVVPCISAASPDRRPWESCSASKAIPFEYPLMHCHVASFNLRIFRYLGTQGCNPPTYTYFPYIVLRLVLYIECR